MPIKFRLILYSLLFMGPMVTLPSFATQPSIAEGFDEIASCHQLANAYERLRCYDNATGFPDMTSPLSSDATSGNSSSQPSALQSAEVSVDNHIDRTASFGAEDLFQRDDENQLRTLRATATAIREDKRGKLIIELANGQIWHQLPGDTMTLRVRKDKDGDGHDVIIKKRSLGAYALRLTTAKRSILVRRVK